MKCPAFQYKYPRADYRISSHNYDLDMVPIQACTDWFYEYPDAQRITTQHVIHLCGARRNTHDRPYIYITGTAAGLLDEEMLESGARGKQIAQALTSLIVHCGTRGGEDANTLLSSFENQTDESVRLHIWVLESV